MTVVDLLVLVYNSLYKRDKATELYETVFLQNPNEDIGVILFQAYIREYKFDEQ
jgi:hypothetical protein